MSVFISTSIPYANGDPHIGFGYEAVIADAIARYYRQQGDVYFSSGLDEHGIKVLKTASDIGMTPQAHVDILADAFQECLRVLHVSNDDFIRTSEKRHHKTAQEIWKRLEASGDIYLHSYEGIYCTGCEAFLTEKDLVDGKCAVHLREPERVSEENYFFKLSKYTNAISDLYASGEIQLQPDFRAKETMQLLEEGLQDISISRPRKNLPWGIPVPGDDSQVMYVWVDALTNYISTLGFAEGNTSYTDFWESAFKRVHVVGKDITRFHAAIWVGMLLSAKLPLPTDILVHGFITLNGQKISKSLGNVISHQDIIDYSSVDAFRYFFLAEIKKGMDIDYTKDRFVDLYNGVLGAKLGNLINRVVTLALKYSINITEHNDYMRQMDTSFLQEIEERYHNAFSNLDPADAFQSVIALAEHANQYLDQTKPWKAETESDRNQSLHYCLEICVLFSDMLQPLLPESAEKLVGILGLPEDINDWKALGEPVILFPRIENIQ